MTNLYFYENEHEIESTRIYTRVGVDEPIDELDIIDGEIADDGLPDGDLNNSYLTNGGLANNESGMLESGFGTYLPLPSEYVDLEQQYRKLMYVYEAAIQQITARINILKGEFEFSNDRNPISSISSRIKSKESIVYKLKKKGLPLTASTLVASVHDIAGVRVICPFIEDVYLVARMLVKQKGIEVVEVKDYIREPKENGYRSLHLIVSVSVEFAEVSRSVPVEIQIRTIAMDFWASTEHQLRYKKDREFTQEVQDKLKECADLMAKADKQMQDIAGDFTLEQW